MQNESDPQQRPPREPLHRITYRTAKRVVILVIGGTLFLFGLLTLFTPMPGAAAVLVVGLGILGLEFEFAHRWLETFKQKSAAAAERFKRKPGGK